MPNSFPAAEGDIDDDGYWTTTHWLIPEQAELIYGGLASVIIIGLLIWKAGPAAKKAFVARTARVEEELDEAAEAQASAEAEAARIVTRSATSRRERRRILAEADAQAEALLADGRARLDAEIAELEAKSEADIGTSVGAGLRRATDRDRPHRGRRRGTGRRALARRRDPPTPGRGLHPTRRCEQRRKGGHVSERVFERANHHYGAFAHWCPVNAQAFDASHDSVVHQ